MSLHVEGAVKRPNVPRKMFGKAIFCSLVSSFIGVLFVRCHQHNILGGKIVERQIIWVSFH